MARHRLSIVKCFKLKRFMGMARVFPEDYLPEAAADYLPDAAAQFSGREHLGLITQPLLLTKHVEGRSDSIQTASHIHGESGDRVIEHGKALASYPLSICIDLEESWVAYNIMLQQNVIDYIYPPHIRSAFYDQTHEVPQTWHIDLSWLCLLPCPTHLYPCICSKSWHRARDAAHDISTSWSDVWSLR